MSQRTPSPMQMPSCEICNTMMNPWNLGDDNVLFRCPSCSHIRRDLHYCLANARTHPWGGASLFDRFRNSLTFRSIRNLVQMDGSKRLMILELGFGRGYVLRKFLEAGHEAAGIEANMLEVEIDPEVRARGKLMFGDAEEQVLPDNSFDLIYGMHVVEHLRDVHVVFEKMYRALKPSGLFYAITPNANSRGLTLFKHRWWYLEDPTHVRFFSPASIDLALRRAGFHHIQIDTPIWDSVTLEINSLLRYLTRKRATHGTLSSTLTMTVDTMGLPLAVLVRLLNRKICPSMKVVAIKD